jgi:hypothetical protein
VSSVNVFKEGPLDTKESGKVPACGILIVWNIQMSGRAWMGRGEVAGVAEENRTSTCTLRPDPGDTEKLCKCTTDWCNCDPVSIGDSDSHCGSEQLKKSAVLALTSVVLIKAI